MTLDANLLEMLACPKCKHDLEYENSKSGEALICNKCKLKYKVEDGIPLMIIDEAESL